jgi:delta24-sterol reductase
MKTICTRRYSTVSTLAASMQIKNVSNDQGVRQKIPAACNPPLADAEVGWLLTDYRHRVLSLCETLKAHDKRYKTAGGAREKLHAKSSKYAGLDKVLRIKLDPPSAHVGANVTMEALVEATQNVGLVPIVVIGSRTMSVADAFATTTNASSSARYGTFDCTVQTAQFVLGNGSFETSEIAGLDSGELLQRSSGAFSSLGIPTMLEISLRWACPCVELTFTPVYSVAQMISDVVYAAWQCALLDPNNIEYIEAIMFDEYSGMIITGRSHTSADCSGPLAFKQGADFTDHVHMIWNRGQDDGRTYTEVLPLDLYLFRHSNRKDTQKKRDKRRKRDNRASWPALKLRSDTAEVHTRRYFDFAVSESAAEETMRHLLMVYDSWPVWVCPVMTPECFGRKMNFGFQPDARELSLNVAFWSSSQGSHGVIDAYLARSKSFRYMRSRFPCRAETIWFDHDERRHAYSRSKWNAGSLADIHERTAAL